MSFLSADNLGKFFASVGNIIQHIEHWFTDPYTKQKAINFTHEVTSLLDVALPLAQEFAPIVAGVIPPVIATEIIAALTAINHKVEDIINEPDPAKKKGLILSTVSEAVRQKLANDAKSGKPFSLGDRILSDVNEILSLPESLFDSAAQVAYGIWHNATR